MFVGVLILLMGVVMLLNQMGIIRGDFTDFIVPIALVALGASMIFDKSKKIHKGQK